MQCSVTCSMEQITKQADRERWSLLLVQVEFIFDSIHIFFYYIFWIQFEIQYEFAEKLKKFRYNLA